MDYQAIYQDVVNAQSVLPGFRENERAAAILAGLRRRVSVIEEPFIYSSRFLSTDPDPLAPGLTVTRQIQIQADADFVIMSAAYEADVAGGSQVLATYNVPNVAILLTDTGNGRQLMDFAQPIGVMAGDSRLPFIWPVPKIMSARSVLTVQATSFEAAVTWNLRLAFHGKKLYPLAG
jgi:hypothetical protein